MGIHWFVTSSGDCPGWFLVFIRECEFWTSAKSKSKGGGGGDAEGCLGDDSTVSSLSNTLTLMVHDWHFSMLTMTFL